MTNSGFVPDNTNIKKTSGTPNLFFDTRDNVFFERDPDNIAYEVTSTQMPAMVGGAFVDLYLTKGHIREPHWHPNALTPPEVFQMAYGVDSSKIADALSPIKESVVIGPPAKRESSEPITNYLNPDSGNRKNDRISISINHKSIDI